MRTLYRLAGDGIIILSQVRTILAAAIIRLAASRAPPVWTW